MNLTEHQQSALRIANAGPLFAKGKGKKFSRAGSQAISPDTIRVLVGQGLLEEGLTRFLKPMVKITAAGRDAIGIRDRGYQPRRSAYSRPEDDQPAPSTLHDRIAP